MHSRYQTRLDKLRRAVRKVGAEAILITDFVNVTYLTGFTGDDSYLLVTSQGQVILSDPRYTTQLQEECPGLDCEIRRPSSTMLQSVSRTVRKSKISRLSLEADSMTLAVHEEIKGELTKTSLIPNSGLVEQLRAIKDRFEIEEIRRSVRMAQRTFDVIRATIRGDQTEKSITNDLEHQIRKFGGRGCSFPPIVAVGERSALPHAVPTDRRIEDSDFVLIDWGAQAGLYMSDLTRVLVTGRISPKLRNIYGVVLKAQRRAIAAIKPGVLACDVDAAARDVITKAGFGKRFGHGLGHGIGLRIHEAPRMNVNLRQPLQAGMVVTVEPGIYLPKWGGVRIEDDVLVTRTGHEVLSDVPKDLDSCIVA